jgi:hypothetical protein
LGSGNRLILQLPRWDVEHDHGPIGHPGAKPYGNGVLLWLEVNDFDDAATPRPMVSALSHAAAP